MKLQNLVVLIALGAGSYGAYENREKITEWCGYGEGSPEQQKAIGLAKRATTVDGRITNEQTLATLWGVKLEPGALTWQAHMTGPSRSVVSCALLNDQGHPLRQYHFLVDIADPGTVRNMTGNADLIEEFGIQQVAPK